MEVVRGESVCNRSWGTELRRILGEVEDRRVVGRSEGREWMAFI